MNNLLPSLTSATSCNAGQSAPEEARTRHEREQARERVGGGQDVRVGVADALGYKLGHVRVGRTQFSGGIWLNPGSCLALAANFQNHTLKWLQRGAE